MTVTPFDDTVVIVIEILVTLIVTSVVGVVSVHLRDALRRWRERGCAEIYAGPIAALLRGEAAELQPLPFWIRDEFVTLWTRLAEGATPAGLARLRVHLVALGAEREVGRLLRRKDTDGLVHGTDAARLLGYASAAPRLRALVQHPHPAVRFCAWRALLEIDPLQAFPALAEELVGAPRWNVARHSALFRADADHATAALATAALAAPPGQAASLLQLLAEGDDPAVLDTLIERHAASADPTERAWCLHGIGRFGSARERDLVLGSLDDPDEQVRRQAVAALGCLAEPADRERLAKGLRDPSFWVRQSAAAALLAVPWVERAELEALQARLDDPHGRDALAAVLARPTP